MVAEQFERFNWHAFRHFGVPATQIGAELASKIIQTFLKHSCLIEIAREIDKEYAAEE